MRTSVKDECNVGRLVVKKNSFLQLSHKLNAMVYDLGRWSFRNSAVCKRTREEYGQMAFY